MHKRYQVECKKCSGKRTIDIHRTTLGETIDWLEDKQTEPFTIISGRKRLDDYWGWECICGNNSILTAQERRTISNPASPKPQEINEVIKNLERPDAIINGGEIIVNNFILREA